jgi:hypothetical protein
MTMSRSLKCISEVLVVFCLFIAEVHGQTSYSGSLKYGLRKLNPITGKFYADESFWTDQRIWYKDSLVIQEVASKNYLYDSSWKESFVIGVLKYTFLDMRSMTFYEYKSFSDTAKMVERYLASDTAHIPGGWAFYKYTPGEKYNGFGKAKILTDTVIDDITYKRITRLYTRQGQMDNIVPEKYINYYRCDKKGMMMFSLYRELNEIDCVCSRIDIIPTAEGYVTLSRQVFYLADSLTPAEQKVFTAWEKYAKENPVHQ